MIDEVVLNPASGYLAIVAIDDDDGSPSYGMPVGYVCYGPTPMTAHTYDLYWIVADPGRLGRGIGAALQRAVEADLLSRGGRTIRIETSSRPDYEGTTRFYERARYTLAGRIADFYQDGDDLLIFSRRLR